MTSSLPLIMTKGEERKPCSIFGSPATLNLCSKCYRNLQLKEQQSSNAKLVVNQSLTTAVLSSAEAASSVEASSFIQDPSGSATEVKALAAAEEVKEEPRTANRCRTCRSRVGLMGFKCRCEITFCDMHRYPELHGCEFDFKALGREEINTMFGCSVDEIGIESGDSKSGLCSSPEVVVVTQKVIAEAIGTYFLIFAGCGSVAVNKIYGSVTFPGICVVWGLIVMVMVYSVGHISGAHFNPAVTITFAIFRHFPWKQVPLYIIAQLLGSILASGTLCLVFEVNEDAFYGTLPVGSQIRSLVLEMIISFLLMFVISGVATDNRSTGEMAGIAVGMTIMLNVFVAGPVSGASMNPARSIGPAIVMHQYRGLWLYIIGPIIGTVLGGFAYNLIRFTDKPLREITKSGSFLRSVSRASNAFNNV